MLTSTLSPHELMNKFNLDYLETSLSEKNRAYVNLKDEKGNFLIHRAARTGHSNLILEIIFAGAEVNYLSLKKETALWVALKYGHYLTAEILIACGASKELARRAGHFEKEKLMRQPDLSDFWLRNNKRALYNLDNLTVKPETFSAILLWQIRHPNNAKNSLFPIMKAQLYSPAATEEKWIPAVDASGMSRVELLIDQMQNKLMELACLARQESCSALAHEIDIFLDNSGHLEKKAESKESFSNYAEYFTCFEKAYKEDNFCLLFKLLKNSYADFIFPLLVKSLNKPLTTFWIISNRKNLPSLAATDLSYESSALSEMKLDTRLIHLEEDGFTALTQSELLNSMVSICGGKLGLLSHIVDSLICSDTESKSKLRLFFNLNEKNNIHFLVLLLAALAEYYNLPNLMNINVKQNKTSFFIMNPPKDEYSMQLVASYFDRFKVKVNDLPCQNLSMPSSDILQIILGYLDDKQRQDILKSKELSPLLNFSLRNTIALQSTQEAVLKNRLEELNQVMEQFLDALNLVYRMGYPNNCNKKLSFISLAITLGLVAFEIYYLVKLTNYIHLLDETEGSKVIPEPTAHATCYDLYTDYTNYLDKYINERNFCGSYLPERSTAGDQQALFVIGQIITDLALFISCGYVIYYNYRLRPNSHAEDFANLEIKIYPHLASSTANLKLKLQETKQSVSPLPGASLIPDIKDITRLRDAENKRQSIETYQLHIKRLLWDLNSTRDIAIDITDTASPQSLKPNESSSSSSLTEPLLKREDPVESKSPVSSINSKFI